jgi:hypothetical protein
MLRWIEGFDIDYPIVNMLRKYNYYNSEYVNPGTPRLGAGYAAYAAVGGPVFRTPSKGAVRTMVVGMGIFPQSVGSDQKIFQFCDPTNSDAEQISLWMTDATGSKTRFKIKRGVTVLGIASIDIDWGSWIFLEFKAIMDTDGTDGECYLRINEATVIAVTGADTTSSSGSTIDKAEWFLTTDVNDWGVDDMYVLDDTGTENNDYLGNSAVRGRLPNGDGALTQWNWQGTSPSTNWDRVSEAAIDDSTTYNDVDTAITGRIDLFTKAALTEITSAIYGVQITHSYKLDAAGDVHARLKFRNPTPTVANGPDREVNVTDHYLWFTEMYEKDPTINADWTVVSFNAMQIGYENRA